MTLRTSLPVLGFLLATAAPAQLRINEILMDPVGSNAGRQIIEIRNTSGGAFLAPSDWVFCIRPYYPPIPQVQIPAGGVVRVHLYATGTNTATDWYVPAPFGETELPLNGELAIYSTNQFFEVPPFMVDFVSWGEGASALSRIDVAVAIALWPSEFEHLELPFDEGSTMARFDTGTGAASYYEDSTPTLGAPNQPASFSTFGTGCLAQGSVPVMDIVPGQLPWLDESYTVRISNLPASPFPVGVLGLSDKFFGPIPLPQDLGFLGFPGCLDYISADYITGALPNAGGVASWDILIPSSVPGLIGLKFFTQGVVIFNGTQGAVSNAATHVIGGVR